MRLGNSNYVGAQRKTIYTCSPFSLAFHMQYYYSFLSVLFAISLAQLDRPISKRVRQCGTMQQENTDIKPEVLESRTRER